MRRAAFALALLLPACLRAREDAATDDRSVTSSLAGPAPVGGEWGGQAGALAAGARGEASELAEGLGRDGRLRAQDDDGRGDAVPPRLIRTGQVAVVVDDFAPFQAELDAWLAAAGGHVADASLSHTDGAVGWGSLTVRVPAEHLDALVGWTEERVQVESLSLRTADVTAEWVDVAARIDNGRREEARLQELLGEATGDLADVLAVERELARVRGEVESAEGRMRVLRDQVGMSTLVLEVRVRTPYAALVAPSFGDEAADVFGRSLAAMGATARGLALLAVAVSPWLAPPLLLLAGLLALLRRRRVVAA